MLRIYYNLKSKQTKRNNNRNHYSEHGYCPGCFKHWAKEERMEDTKKNETEYKTKSQRREDIG
jgi:hypothetical protein